MGRKPYPKYKMTTDEYNAVDKLADELKCGWFSIREAFVDVHGKIHHRKLPNTIYAECDICFDLESPHYMSLQYGLRNLNEAFEADEKLNSTFISKDELDVYKKLLRKLNII